MPLYSKNIWDSEKKNVVDMDSWKICDHCKRHHKLYLNYNSEGNSLPWADIIEKILKWDKQHDMDDKNQKTTHNIEFLKKSQQNTPCNNGPLFLEYCKSRNGCRREIKTF